MVWTRDLDRAHRVAGRIRTGMVWVNCFFERELRAPFGGVGWSGIGREGGALVARLLHRARRPSSCCTASGERPTRATHGAHRGRGHRRAGGRAGARRARRPLPRLRGGARDPPAGRRHQPAAARGRACSHASASTSGSADAGRRDRRAALLQPPRPAHLERAARTRRRLRLAAVLGAPRRPADGAAATPSWSGSGTTRSSPTGPSRRSREDGGRRDRAARTPRRRRDRRGRPRRPAGRRRRHPLRGPRGSSTRHGGGVRYGGRLLWRAITRARAVPRRPHDDHGRPPGPEVRLLPDHADRRRRPLADQLDRRAARPGDAPPPQDW